MTDGRVVAIIQARMGSSRLPGKVLLDIAGQPMLAHVVRRTSLADTVDQVVVATSTESADDPIVEFCAANGVESFRGHPTDVLDRYYQAAKEFGAQYIARITGDCPLMDPDLVDLAVSHHRESRPSPDLTLTRLPARRSYPIGLDIEICSTQVLGTVWSEAASAHQREHVMPFLYEDSDRFEVDLLHADGEYGALRWTVDTAEDLEFVRAVYDHFSPRVNFGWREVLDLVQSDPNLSKINAGVDHKSQWDVDERAGQAGSWGSQ